MDNNNIISKQIVVLETPPDESSLKNLSIEQLISICRGLYIPRESYENIVDDIKKKSFLISEILRLNPPFPIYTNPVLLDSKYDEINMTKTNTFRYIKHINNDGKYKHSIITEESYKVPLTQRELKNRDYENLMNSINQEIASLNLDDYKNKEDILRFACELYPGKSSGEKYKRATLLNKAVINHMRGEKYNHRRITHFDISVY